MEGKSVARALLVRSDDDDNCIYISCFHPREVLGHITPLPEGVTLHYCVL